MFNEVWIVNLVTMSFSQGTLCKKRKTQVLELLRCFNYFPSMLGHLFHHFWTILVSSFNIVYRRAHAISSMSMSVNTLNTVSYPLIRFQWQDALRPARHYLLHGIALQGACCRSGDPRARLVVRPFPDTTSGATRSRGQLASRHRFLNLFLLIFDPKWHP